MRFKIKPMKDQRNDYEACTLRKLLNAQIYFGKSMSSYFTDSFYTINGFHGFCIVGLTILQWEAKVCVRKIIKSVGESHWPNSGYWGLSHSPRILEQMLTPRICSWNKNHQHFNCWGTVATKRNRTNFLCEHAWTCMNMRELRGTAGIWPCSRRGWSSFQLLTSHSLAQDSKCVLIQMITSKIKLY